MIRNVGREGDHPGGSPGWSRWLGAAGRLSGLLSGVFGTVGHLGGDGWIGVIVWDDWLSTGIHGLIEGCV